MTLSCAKLPKIESIRVRVGAIGAASKDLARHFPSRQKEKAALYPDLSGSLLSEWY
jgi:hypothetical protein